MGNGILTFIEHRGGTIAEGSLEAVTEARRLAEQLQAQVSGVLFGPLGDNAITVLGEYGVDRLWLVEGEEDEALVDYVPGSYTQTLVDLISKEKPDVFLFGSSTLGHDVAARVAARLRCGLVPNGYRLRLTSNGYVVADRLGYGGQVQATVSFAMRPQVVTLRAGAAMVSKSPQPRYPEVMRLCHRKLPGNLMPELIGYHKATPRTMELAEAEVVVVGGHGVSGAEGFEMLWDLAELLGGTVGATRVACDNGWISKERQIGLSGEVVAPRLLISCGVSGAIQHAAGIKDTQTLIAINTDPHAPIFGLADFGIVGDLYQVVPAMIQEIQGFG